MVALKVAPVVAPTETRKTKEVTIFVIHGSRAAPCQGFRFSERLLAQYRNGMDGTDVSKPHDNLEAASFDRCRFDHAGSSGLRAGCVQAFSSSSFRVNRSGNVMTRSEYGLKIWKLMSVRETGSTSGGW